MGSDQHVRAVTGLVGGDEVGTRVHDGLNADRDAVGLSEGLSGLGDSGELVVIGPDDEVFATTDSRSFFRGLFSGLGGLLGGCRGLFSRGLRLATTAAATRGQQQGHRHSHCPEHGLVAHSLPSGRSARAPGLRWPTSRLAAM